MSGQAPRCGRVMRRCEAWLGPLLEAPVCGRPPGHAGDCRSVPAMRRQSARGAESKRRWRQARQLEALQARRRAVLAEALRGFDCDGWRHAA